MSRTQLTRLCLMLAMFAACADDATSTTAQAARYTLRWTHPDATRVGEALVFTNDLGYQITLRAGYLTTYSVELVPCEQDQLAALTARAWDAAWWLAGAPATAWAGHSSERGPNAIGPLVERVGDAQDQEHTASTLPTSASCKLHYLVARADADTPRDAAAPDMVNTTLLLEGEYLAPQSATPAPFVLRTTVANARLDTLEIAVARDDAPRVILERRADKLFEGVALDEQDEDTIMRQVLINLIDHTHLTLD